MRSDSVVPEWVARSRGSLLRPGPALAAFGAAAVAFFAWAQRYGLQTLPARDMGHLQKILYVHVPSAWIAFLSFFVVLVAAVWYLASRADAADRLAASAAEVGTLLNGLVLVQGMIWAKPTWGVWWTWDPRLTSTLVLFLIFVGYLALRALVDDPDRRARWSALVGILGALVAHAAPGAVDALHHGPGVCYGAAPQRLRRAVRRGLPGAPPAPRRARRGGGGGDRGRARAARGRGVTGEWGYVAAAYGLTWGTLLVYWGYVMLRGRRARRALEEVLQGQPEDTA